MKVTQVVAVVIASIVVALMTLICVLGLLFVVVGLWRLI